MYSFLSDIPLKRIGKCSWLLTLIYTLNIETTQDFSTVTNLTNSLRVATHLGALLSAVIMNQSNYI